MNLAGERVEGFSLPVPSLKRCRARTPAFPPTSALAYTHLFPPSTSCASSHQRATSLGPSPGRKGVSDHHHHKHTNLELTLHTPLPSLQRPMGGSQGNQILIVWSTLPVATTFTSFSGSPESTSTPFTPFFSLAPPAGCRPHARVATKWLWASTVLTQRPVESSHTRIVLSSEEERRYLPEGWKARARTQLSCPAWRDGTEE